MAIGEHEVWPELVGPTRPRSSVVAGPAASGRPAPRPRWRCWPPTPARGQDQVLRVRRAPPSGCPRGAPRRTTMAPSTAAAPGRRRAHGQAGQHPPAETRSSGRAASPPARPGSGAREGRSSSASSSRSLGRRRGRQACRPLHAGQDLGAPDLFAGAVQGHDLEVRPGAVDRYGCLEVGPVGQGQRASVGRRGPPVLPMTALPWTRSS